MSKQLANILINIFNDVSIELKKMLDAIYIQTTLIITDKSIDKFVSMSTLLLTKKMIHKIETSILNIEEYLDDVREYI